MEESGKKVEVSKGKIRSGHPVVAHVSIFQLDI